MLLSGETADSGWSTNKISLNSIPDDGHVHNFARTCSRATTHIQPTLLVTRQLGVKSELQSCGRELENDDLRHSAEFSSTVVQFER